jgi:hypothetical protein
MESSRWFRIAANTNQLRVDTQSSELDDRGVKTRLEAASVTVRHTVSAMLALLVTAMLSGCPADACEAKRSWRNASTSACQSCITMSCAMEQMTVTNVQSDCQSEFACVARCPDQSALTCGCIEGCLATMRCSDAVNALTRCAAAHCGEPCH